MKSKVALILSATLLLFGCGNTSKIDEIAASQQGTSTSSASQQESTKSPSEIADPILSTVTTTTIQKQSNSDNTKVETLDPNGEFDVDLTQLSSSMVYGQVYEMVYNPDEYIGKTVKMHGPFAYYKDETTGKEYFAVLITDAMACCSQGIEFELEGNHKYPDDYPELNSEITVTGTFNKYEENNIPYIELLGAQIIA